MRVFLASQSISCWNIAPYCRAPIKKPIGSQPIGLFMLC